MEEDIIRFQEFLKSNKEEQSKSESFDDVEISFDDDLNGEINLTEERVNYLLNDFGISEEEINNVISVKNQETDEEYYNLYRDINENFTCDIFIEGANVEKSFARIILESEDWNLIFNGFIENGKCIVPVKKLDILKENLIGKIKLEIIAENSVFVPWESKFCIKTSKKISTLNEKISK